MKTKKVLLSLLFIMGISVNSNAQFFKKLEKRAKEKIEREAERRAQRRVDRKIDKTFDGAESEIDKVGKKKKSKKNKKDKKIKLANKYHFEWKYVLRMESNKTKGKGDLKMIYYLNPHTPTFATKFEMDGQQAMPRNMITIMDPTTGASVMLMEVEGNKIRQNMPSFSSDDEDDVAQQQAVNNYTIVKTDTKTILDYQCQGFKITSPDGITTMYIAQNAPVSFNNTMSSDPKYKPKGFDPKWMNEFKDGLMLEMEFKSNKKEKYNVKMTCVELVEESLDINMKEYKSFEI